MERQTITQSITTTDDFATMERQAHYKDYSVRAVVLIFLVPAYAGLLFGYDIGGTSFALQSLLDVRLGSVLWSETVRESAAWQGIVVSAASFGGLLSSTLVLLTGLGDLVGRKRELQIGGLLYLLGGCLEYSSLYMDHGLSWLILGRIIYGLGVGLSMHAAPTYLGEMSPASIRGLLISLKEAAIVTGILLGYIVGYAFSETSAGWAHVYATSMLGSTLMLGLSLHIPRSCRWLLLKGRDKEAMEAIRFVHPDNAEDLFRTIKDDSVSLDAGVGMGVEEDVLTSKPSWASILDAKNRAPLVAGVGLVVLQQVTGQPSVLSYASTIFKSVGLSGVSSIIVALWKLVATLCSATAVETYGRKVLLYTGCSLMLVTLVMLSFLLDNPNSRFGRLAVIVAMMGFVGGYQLGFGPISWLMTSEIFPLMMRTRAVAFAVQMNFLLNTVVQFAVPLLEKQFGLRGTFALFAVMSGYRWVCTWHSQSILFHPKCRRMKPHIDPFLFLSAVSTLCVHTYGNKGTFAGTD